MAIFTFALGVMLGGMFGFLVMAILSAGRDEK
jgi:hypothetical protein